MVYYLNKQIQKLYGFTEQEYIDWCHEKKKPVHNKKSVSDFVWRISTGRLVRDDNGNLVSKRVRRK